jgi:hypothetical protein
VKALYTTVIECYGIPWFISYNVQRNPLTVEVVEISVEGTRYDLYDNLTDGTIEQLTTMVFNYEMEDHRDEFYDGIKEGERFEKKG